MSALHSIVLCTVSVQLSAGQCIGKITKGRKFRLGITALHLIARYAPHKVWLNPGGEQAFVYGNHIIKVRKVQNSFDPPHLQA